MIGRTLTFAALLAFAACNPSGSVAGKYALDPLATRTALEASLKNASLTAPQKAVLELRAKELAANKDLHAEYELKSDGSYHAHQELVPGAHEDVQGTWKADGGTVTFSQTMVEGKAAAATHTGKVTGNEIHLTMGSADSGWLVVLRKK